MATVRKLSVSELQKIISLHEYNNIEEMLAENKRSIESGTIDIFGLFENDILIGELHAMYECDKPQFAERGKRTYLFAFRICQAYQGKGYGSFFIQTVIDMLSQAGYKEFTVGVEDDNERALHIYKKIGFNEIIGRQQEEYQGDRYEYNLYLKR